MTELLDNVTCFFQQQIELYGDEYAVDQTTSLSSGETVDTSTWENVSSLSEFESIINTCRKCALGHSRQKFVFGSGNPNADIVFIGNVPGADEDRAGLPFVGTAGELLTKILAALQLKRDDVFMCTVLKCRPPHNREPLPEEIAVCKEYLIKQLDLVQPKTIVCLGQGPAHVLLETTDSLSELRGSQHTFHNADVLVTHHPAELLKNPAYKKETWDDIKRLLHNNKTEA